MNDHRPVVVRHPKLLLLYLLLIPAYILGFNGYSWFGPRVMDITVIVVGVLTVTAAAAMIVIAVTALIKTMRVSTHNQ